MKATQAHPDVQANEKKQKLAESLEWTEGSHPRIAYDKGGNMVPPTQPANGGYNPDLVPLSDIFTRHLDAWNGRKPVVRAKDWEHLCRQYADRVGPTPYNTGVNVCGLGDAHTVFDHAAEICRLKLVQKARNDAMAQPWARPSNELPPVKWGERHPDVTCDPDNWKTDEFKAWERAKAEEKAAAAEAKKWARSTARTRWRWSRARRARARARARARPSARPSRGRGRGRRRGRARARAGRGRQ